MIMLDRLENIFDNKHQCDSGKFAYVPSPPLTQHFALNERLVLSLGKGRAWVVLQNHIHAQLNLHQKGPPLYNGHFLWQTVHTLTKIKYFFCPHGGHCRQVQL